MGMTPVRLLRVEGLKLILGPCDLIDGTPVFDIKPYIPSYDAFPDERAGWVGELDAALATPPEFFVKLAPLTESQCDWLADTWNIDFRARMTELLERDPSSHRTRRIRKRADGFMEITCGAWRAFFEISDKAVTVLSISPAFPEGHLRDLSLTRVPDREAQLAFIEKWPAL